MSTAAHLTGTLLLLVCLITALALALEHLGGLHLPGCGEGSPCAQAAASVWGKLPYLNWPVSFLGVAYFLGMLVAWLSNRRAVPSGLRYLARAGALLSLAFVVIMIVEAHSCSYCIATHVANFAFWIIVERVGRTATGSLPALATAAVVFAGCSLLLGVTQWRERQTAGITAEEELADSTAEIIAATSQRSEDAEEAPEVAVANDEPVVEPAAPAPETPVAVTSVDEPTEADATTQPDVLPAGFTGRHRLGPEKAAIRVVMVSDFQCEVCERIESQLATIFRQRSDISLSFKHFPMCADCNRFTKQRPHPNACWAARAAETAAILKGTQGFWDMHAWLFERRGSFTRQELRDGLRELGYQIAEFERIMQSPETLTPVLADVEEAIGLGIYQTPAIFINGVELRGWNAPNGVARAIQRLAATNPQPMTAAHDQPPPAVEKLIGDWRAERRQRITPRPDRRFLGPETAPVQVVMFGDYQQSGTAKTDALVRDQVASRGDVRYEYRYFPFNRDCNPAVKKETKYPHACRAAQAAQATASLAGADAYWKMHVWLLENQQGFSDATLREAAGEIGIDPDALLAEMESPAVHGAIAADARLCQRLGSTSVPTLFINGRRVPRWELENKSILPRIIAAAAED